MILISFSALCSPIWASRSRRSMFSSMRLQPVPAFDRPMLDVLDKVRLRRSGCSFIFQHTQLQATNTSPAAIRQRQGITGSLKSRFGELRSIARVSLFSENARSASAERVLTCRPKWPILCRERLWLQDVDDLAFACLPIIAMQFNEIVLGQDISDYMIAVRNKGAHAIASLDTAYAAASRHWRPGNRSPVKACMVLCLRQRRQRRERQDRRSVACSGSWRLRCILRSGQG